MLGEAQVMQKALEEETLLRERPRTLRDQAWEASGHPSGDSSPAHAMSPHMRTAQQSPVNPQD